MNYLPQPTPMRRRKMRVCVPAEGPTDNWIDARQELFALRCELSYKVIVLVWRILAHAFVQASSCLSINPKVKLR